MAVPAAGTDTLPAVESPNAAVAPLVVVSDRSPNVVVPVVLVGFTPPLPDPVTAIESNVLAPMLVPPTPPIATRPAAPTLRDRDRPRGREVHRPGAIQPHTRRAAQAHNQVRDVERPRRRVQLKPRLTTRNAAIDDIDVIDRATARITGRTADTAARALRIDLKPAHLIAIIELDHIRAVIGQRRPIHRIRAMQRVRPDHQRRRLPINL